MRDYLPKKLAASKLRGIGAGEGFAEVLVAGETVVTVVDGIIVEVTVVGTEVLVVVGTKVVVVGILDVVVLAGLVVVGLGGTEVVGVIVVFGTTEVVGITVVFGATEVVGTSVVLGGSIVVLSLETTAFMAPKSKQNFQMS